MYVFYQGHIIFTQYFRSLFEVSFSSEVDKSRKEEAAFIYFLDFIEECEGTNELVRSK